MLSQAALLAPGGQQSRPGVPGVSPCCRRAAGSVWGGSHRAHSPLLPPGSRSGVHSGRRSCPPRGAGRRRHPCCGHRRRRQWCSERPGFPVGRSCSLQVGGWPGRAQPVPPAQAMPSWHLAPAPQTPCLDPDTPKPDQPTHNPNPPTAQRSPHTHPNPLHHPETPCTSPNPLTAPARAQPDPPSRCSPLPRSRRQLRCRALP